MDIIERAIKEVGGLTAFSKAMGVSPQCVCNWKARGGIPVSRAYRASQVEAAIAANGGRTDRHDLWPKLFGKRQKAAA